MSDYDKNNIFEVKGAIGELLVANFLWDELKIPYELATDEEQKVGVDLSFIGNHSHNVDVKLSECEEGYFTVTYRNAKGLRHPYRPNGKAHEIIIADFDWSLYLADNSKRLLKRTESELIKSLGRYVKEEDLKKLVEKQRAAKKDTVEALRELYVAHRTLDRLSTEYRKKDTFKDTNNLRKYLRGIFGIHIADILTLASGIEQMEFGEGRSKKGVVLIQKEYRRDRFGNAIEVAKYNRSALEAKGSIDIYYQPLPQLTESPTIAFGKHKGTPIKDLVDSYIKWLVQDAKNPGNQYNLFVEEFKRRKL